MSSTPPALPSHENSLFNTVIPETPDASIIHCPAPPPPPPNPPSPETIAAFRSFAAKFAPTTTEENRAKLQHMLRQFDPITGRPIDRRAELAAAQRRLDDTQRCHTEYMRQARARVDRLKAEITLLNEQRNAKAFATVHSRKAGADSAQASPSESSFIESIMRSGIVAGQQQQQQWQSQRPSVPFDEFDDNEYIASSSMASVYSMELPPMLPPPPPLPPLVRIGAADRVGSSMRHHQQAWFNSHIPRSIMPSCCLHVMSRESNYLIYVSLLNFRQTPKSN